jgi:uncharacterized protein (DUF608 family)
MQSSERRGRLAMKRCTVSLLWACIAVAVACWSSCRVGGAVADRGEEKIMARAHEKLFPTDLPASEWAQFNASGFSKPVCGVIYRFAQPATNGMPLGGVDTGCLDLETTGLLGYCTIFNSHVPRRGPLNLPFLGLSVNGQTWVLSNTQTKAYETTDGRQPVEPVLRDLKPDGVQTASGIHYWGHYPVADLEYETDAPLSVGLRAWAPFLPGDLVRSMIPAIVFEVRLRNHSGRRQRGTIAVSFPGPTRNEAQADRLSRQQVSGPFSGVAVGSEKASYALGVVGREKLRTGGELGADGSAWANIAEALPAAGPDHAGASVAVDFSLGPGKTKIVRFVLAWHSPNWKGGGHPSATEGNTFTHMYALRYGSALQAAQLLAREHRAMLRRVLAWQQAVYTHERLPAWLRESLVNVLHLITEDGMWAAARHPLGWARQEDGLFGMNECPRGCPQIECIPCSFYGNIPLVYFFPELALSTLRGYKHYQYPEGAAPWIFGGVTGQTPPCEFSMPTRGYQTTLNGPCYVDMVNRYLLCHGEKNEDFLREFWPSVKRNTAFTVNLRPEYSVGDGIISMPTGNVGTEWFEAPEPGWFGMVAHVGGIHLAQLRMARRMAEKVGDDEFARQCARWIKAGMNSMEAKMWAGSYYLTYWEPETEKKSDLVFGYQLDGHWMAKFHGLPGVFRAERVKATLETVRRCNVALSKSAAVNYANADGTPAQVAGYGTYSYFPPEPLMLAMTYMYEGQRDFGIELARRCWENIVCKWRYTWDMPNIMRGDADTGERVYGHDYYQDMMLWALPAAIESKDLSGPLRRGGLVARIIRAARGKGDDEGGRM